MFCLIPEEMNKVVYAMSTALMGVKRYKRLLVVYLIMGYLMGVLILPMTILMVIVNIPPLNEKHYVVILAILLIILRIERG